METNTYTPAEAADPVADEISARAVENRLNRALTETLDVEDDAFLTPGVVRVWSGSGSQYVVNMKIGQCSCPDYQGREKTCKHLMKAYFETATDPLTGRNTGCNTCDRETFCMAHL